MLIRLKRYYYTIKYLKLFQICYQIWFRFKKELFPIKLKLSHNGVPFKAIKINDFPYHDKLYHDKDCFRFLNIKHSFHQGLDWDLMQNGKLWVYHLNYFDYLHQSDVSTDIGLRLIREFLADTPNCKIGLEPFPTSLRLINWIKFLANQNTYPKDVIDSIYAQYQLLLKHLEYHLLGNHLLENAFSLLYGALLFDDFRLRIFANRILKKELEEQFLNDGGHFELSPMYHAILLQRSLDVYNLLINNEHKFFDVQRMLETKIEMMINWLYTVRFKNGDLPMVNDSTDNQALDIDTLLDYANKLGFTPSNVSLFDSGYRKLNHSNFELFLDVGKIGPDYQPGHAHSDTLSFILYFKQNPIIVDIGISTYEKNQTRFTERSTASHNTVMVNDIEQSDVWGGFRVGRRAECFIEIDTNNAVKARHNGYDRFGFSHSRTWKFSDSNLLITDTVEGDNVSSKAYFHLAKGITPEILDKKNIRIGLLSIRFQQDVIINIDDYNLCLGFNKSHKAKKIVIEFTNELDTIISPQ